MSINRNTANADATSNLNASQATADTNFIANVDSQIAQAVAMGKFQVTALTNISINLTTVFQYYSGLGYAVAFPDFLNQNGLFPSINQQPVNLFGTNWNAFWMGQITLGVVNNPARITISWV